MADGNVVSLTGKEAVVAGAPDPGVVDFLESMLARAKAGEMRAVAITYVRGNGRPSEGWYSGKVPNDIFVLHSGATCMLGNMTDMLNRCDTVYYGPAPAGA